MAVLLACCGFCVGLVAFPLHAADRWILVDAQALTLTVMQGQDAIATFGDISLGRNGTTRKKIQGDARTPLGTYQITDVRNSARYHRFIAIDYPRVDDARKALKAGDIDEVTYRAILRAHEQGRQPPATTPMGGNIGIHGIGSGDVRVHADFNWTDGCIALTDAQIDELTPLISRGMTVLIIDGTSQ